MYPQINGHGKALTLGILTLLASGVAILWSWNTVAVELLGLPEMGFRHAMALCLLLLSSGCLLAVPQLLLGKTRIG